MIMRFCLRFLFIFFFVFCFSALADSEKAIFKKGISPDRTGRRAGWIARAFLIPPEMKGRVSFWIKIYGVYDSKKVLLHDREDPSIVYRVVDISECRSDSEVNRKVALARAEVLSELKKLSGSVSFRKLSDEERRIYSEFERNGISHLILEYASAGRIRAQRGLKDEFREAVKRSGRYLPLMEAVFLKRDLPWELTRLAFVESLFDPKAVSRVGAAGIWQFMPYTARRFMRVDEFVDERFDPIKSSAAAAELLLLNYKKLGSWPLAITAYNHGAYGVNTARTRAGTSDIISIVEEKADMGVFGFASRNFYAEFLAALYVEQNAKKYFGIIEKEKPIKFATVSTLADVSFVELAKICNVSVDVLADYNPSLTSKVIRGELNVPKGFSLRVPLSSLCAGDSLGSGKNKTSHVREYRVKKGDSLARIASKFSVDPIEIVILNGLKLTDEVRIGQTLKIPVSELGKTDDGTR